MKTLFSFLPILFALLMCSCRNDEESINPNLVTGQWKLTKIETGWTGQTIMANALSYEETYEFKSDSTFKKYRSDGWVATGRYTKTQINGADYIEATFDNREWSSGCYSGKAYLHLTTPGQLFEQGRMCDANDSYYQKVKN